MRVALYLTLGAMFSLLTAGNAVGTAVGPDVPICAASEDQWNPDISGSTVVWTDERRELTDYMAVYGHELTTGEEFPIATDYQTNYYYASISGSKVVWHAWPYWTGIYGKDLDTGMSFSVGSGPKTTPDISGETVVWMDRRDEHTNSFDIYGKDLSSGQEFAVCAELRRQWYPAISGSIVVWADERNSSVTDFESDIYGYDLATDQEFPVCIQDSFQSQPCVSGGLVAWRDSRNYTTTGYDIYGYDMGTEEEFPICVLQGNQSAPAISGDIVVYADSRNAGISGSDIYGCDLSTSEEFPICTAQGNQSSPQISGNVVVWKDERNEESTGTDIYGCQLSPGHLVSVEVAADPETIESAGATVLSATLSDELGHGAAYWRWYDNGAGGSFVPAPDVQSPTWIAPGNLTGSAVVRRLTVVACCDGSPFVLASGSVEVIEEPPTEHSVNVTATAEPAAVPSGGTTQLGATASDSLGHGIALWEWTDNGAGGAFSPSRYVQSPTWTAPENFTDVTLHYCLTVTATCSGLPPTSGSSDVYVDEAPAEVAVLPLDGGPQSITASPTDPVYYEITVPAETPHLFVTMRYRGPSFHPGRSEMSLYYERAEVASSSGYDDLIVHVPGPAAGTYFVRISASGPWLLGASTSLRDLPLGDWVVGTIYGDDGSAWHQVTCPAGQAALYLSAETIGDYSDLEVYCDTAGEAVCWRDSGRDLYLEIPSPEPGVYYVHLMDSGYVYGGDQTRDYMIMADVEPIEPPLCTEPLITSISPTAGGTGGPVTVHIEGRCFDPYAAVCLSRHGNDDVCAISVVADEDGTMLEATFDLAGAASGEWTLTVTNPDSQMAVAPAPFIVEAGGEANIWVTVLGREYVRAGREVECYIEYGNSGDIDALDVVLTLEVPPGVEILSPTPPGAVLLSRTPGAATEPGESGLLGWIDDRVPPDSKRGAKIAYRISKPTGLLTLILKAYYGIIGACFAHTDRLLQGQDPAIASGETERQYREFMEKEVDRPISFWDFGSRFVGHLNDALGVSLDAADYYQDLEEMGRLGEDLSDAFDVEADVSEAQESTMDIRAVASTSPEDKYGPSGWDAAGTPLGERQRWVPADRPVDYRIDFWNKEDAAAATCDVIITDELDADLDWSTFTFTEVGFLDWRAELEPCQCFNIDIEDVVIDLSQYYPGAPVVELVVNVEGIFDPIAGQIEWVFRALDPITRDYPEHPLAGFLPPMTASGWEIGWVDFTVAPLPDLPSGTTVENQAWVKFDVDEFKPAPKEGPYINTLDAEAPSSQVLALNADQQHPFFMVSWEGQDDPGGCGIGSYDLYVSEDGGAPSLYRGRLSDTRVVFQGSRGREYGFYVRACDHVGNLEAAPAEADARTVAGAGFPDVPEGAWGHDEIYLLVANEICEGFPEGTYEPSWAMTRDQMAAYIARALAGGDDSVPDPQGDPTFADVPEDHWAYRYVEYAVLRSVVAGYDDGLYHPEYEVTRDQMAVYMARSVVEPTGEDGLRGYTPPTSASFADVPEGSWAYKHIEYCVEEQTVKGYDDGCYHPDWRVTRDQMAVYIVRAFGLGA